MVFKAKIFETLQTKILSQDAILKAHRTRAGRLKFLKKILIFEYICNEVKLLVVDRKYGFCDKNLYHKDKNPYFKNQ